MLPDGQWHQVSVGVSSSWLALYVDCELVERVNWTFPGQGITTDGLLMLGDIIEGFETPFEVRAYWMLKCYSHFYLQCLLVQSQYIKSSKHLCSSL